jgi:hypothetical protein
MCLRLAEEGGAAVAYLQIALNILAICNTETMTTTETPDAVALIDLGVDLHAKASNGSTSLHLACVKGHAEAAKALLEKGADLHAKGGVGYTPLHIAFGYDHCDITAMLRAKCAVELAGVYIYPL